MTARREPPRGNGCGDRADNYLVPATAELMEVIRDLCRFAAAYRLVGQDVLAETLTEQCADLLAHRARLNAGSLSARSGVGRSVPGTNVALFFRGTEWTN